MMAWALRHLNHQVERQGIPRAALNCVCMEARAPQVRNILHTARAQTPSRSTFPRVQDIPAIAIW